LLGKEKAIIARRNFGQEEILSIFVLRDKPVMIEFPPTKYPLKMVFDSTLYSERASSRKSPLSVKGFRSGDRHEFEGFSTTVFAT